MHQLTFVAPHELVWNEVPEPEIDDPRAALVRPVAVASCDLDAGIVAGSTPLPGPFAFGHEFVADVVEVGDGVRKFAAGQRVVVSFQISCGTCDPCLRAPAERARRRPCTSGRASRSRCSRCTRLASL